MRGRCLAARSSRIGRGRSVVVVAALCMRPARSSVTRSRALVSSPARSFPCVRGARASTPARAARCCWRDRRRRSARPAPRVARARDWSRATRADRRGDADAADGRHRRGSAGGIPATPARRAGGAARRRRRRRRRGRRRRRPEVNYRRAGHRRRSRAVINPALICFVAWLVPGAGHLWQGRRQKGLVFLVAIPLMFAIGLWLNGRLFPFELSQPLVALAAFATWATACRTSSRSVLGLGQGRRDRGVVRVRQHVSDRGGAAQHARRARRLRHRDGPQVMTSHLGLLILFALFVSTVFAVLMRDSRASRCASALRLFGGFVGAASCSAG